MYQNKKGEPLELVLYKYDTCWFCRSVMAAIEEMQLTISYRDIHHDSGAIEELMKVGGKGQVPCLFINGTALYESATIIHFLETQVLEA